MCIRDRWDIAGSLLARLISVSETKAEPRMEGIARYRLAFILRDQARFEQAEAEIKGAIRAFKASGSTAWERAARMEEALDKSLRDRGHEAIQTLKDLLGQLGDEDRLWRATVQVNLAYVCQEMGRFREGADAAKAAFDLFLKEGDSEGVLTSLTNLTACLGQLDLHVLAEPYARRIVKLGVALQRPRIKAAGLNQLASSLRAKGDPRRAIDCLREAISICQQLDMQRTELTNILNLGNAYKDLQDWEHAEDCYQEGLTRAKVAGFGPVVGHALLLFAMLRQAQSRYEEALSFAKEAGDANQKIGQQLRVAQAHAAAARALSSLGKHAEAAQEFEEAAAGVGQVGDLQESTSHHVSASKEWAQAGNTQRCVVSVDAALSGHLGRDDITSAADALSGLTDNFSLDGLHERFDKLFGQYLADPSRANLAGTMHSYSTYCKRSRNGKPGTQFFSTLSLLAKHAAVHPNVLSALVIGIEQADERLLSSRQLDTLASSLVDSLDGFSYRVLPDLSSVCTTIWPQDPPVVIQVISLSKELVLRRLALATTLAMLAGEKQVLLDVSAAGQLRGSTSAFFFALLDDFEKNVMKLPEGSVTDEMPAIMMESNVPFAEPQPAMPIIIHDSYPSIADWSVHPQNKALVWLLMNVYAQTVEQLTHMKLRDDAPTARRARQFCEVLFGYRNSTDTNEELLIPRYRVADIDAVLKSLKSNG